MKLARFAVVIIILLSVISCSSTRYISDSLGEIDNSIYHTYMMEDNCADDINPVMQIRIKNALERTFINHEYSKNPNADILIKYFVKNLSKKYVEECREEYARWDGGKVCQERVVNYAEGSLVIDIIDTSTHTIIWHGAAYGPQWSSIKNPNKKIDEVVNTLLQKYFDS